MTAEPSHGTPTPEGWGHHLRATLALGLPLILGHLAQTATHLTDTIMLGWYSVEALAAAVLATSLFFVLFLVGSGFSMAVMPMAANAEARGDRTAVRRVVRMGFWASTAFSLAVIPLLWWSETVFRALGQGQEVSAAAQVYMRIAMWGMVPSLFVMVFKSFFSALERPRIVPVAAGAGAALNALFNYAFIFGNWGAPEMGLRGAAWASVVTQLMTLGVLVAYARGVAELRDYALFQRLWRPDWRALDAVFRLGWPIGATMLAESGLFSASAIMMGWLGTIPLAAHGIALQIASITFMLHLGLSNAATVRAGRAMGRGDAAGLGRAAAAALALSGVAAVAVIALYLSIPRTLLGLFLDAADPEAPEIIALGVGLLMAAAAFQLVDALQVMALGLLRGLQDTRWPMFWTAFAYWGVGAPSGYLLGFHAGLAGVGIWSGLVVGLAVAGTGLAWRFVMQWRRLGGTGAAGVG